MIKRGQFFGSKSEPQKNDEPKIDLGVIAEPDLLANVLRPRSFDRYIGQDEAKNQIRLLVDAAKSREEACDHILIYGPAGLGKTTLANIVATEMNSELRITAGPVLEKQGDLAAILSSLRDGSILFIDEIHRLRPQIEEVLYGAMEDFVLDLVVGKGVTAKTLRLNLPKFTLVGATTKPHKISSPLRERFGGLVKLDYYQDAEIAEIVTQSATILNLELKLDAAMLLANCSRGIPRVANRLLKRVSDYCLVNSESIATLDHVKQTLAILGLDESGLSRLDVEVLKVLNNNFAGGPVGLSTLSAYMHEDRDTLSEVVEPFLLKLGFLQRSHRGRIVTEAGKKYLKQKV